MKFLDENRRKGGGFYSATYDPDHDPYIMPCPFCGAPSRHVEVHNTHTASYWVECQECEAQAHGSYSGRGRSKREHARAVLSAISAWNRRTP